MSIKRITDAKITDDGVTLLVRVVDGRGKALGLRLKASDLWPAGGEQTA